MTLTDRCILAIALPSIVSNITVPLLGLVDVAITGHVGGAAAISAIAVGGMIFNVIYWVFGFLRMGTSGMTSQAFGGNDEREVLRLLLRSLAAGLSVALIVVVLQHPLLRLALMFIGPTPDVMPMVRTYFGICVWGAPAVLCLYGLLGWSIGMQNARIPMFVSIMQNVVNIATSLFLVVFLRMGIEGVAYGTLIAQYVGLGIAAVLLLYKYGAMRHHASADGLFSYKAMSRFFSVNSDIFLRTLFLVAVNLYFLSAGASQGAVILAVNTIMMQFFTLFSYVMDGFAYAGEALCGRCYGECDMAALHSTVRRLFGWGAALTVVYTIAYVLGGSAFVSLLTDDNDVIEAAAVYFPWVVAIPVAGVAAFIWDGVFIGTTSTRGMLMSSFFSAVVFFAVYLSLRQAWSNHALWLSFIVYLLTRGVVQGLLYVVRTRRYK